MGKIFKKIYWLFLVWVCMCVCAWFKTRFAIIRPFLINVGVIYFVFALLYNKLPQIQRRKTTGILLQLDQGVTKDTVRLACFCYMMSGALAGGLKCLGLTRTAGEKNHLEAFHLYVWCLGWDISKSKLWEITQALSCGLGYPGIVASGGLDFLHGSSGLKKRVF